MVFVMGCILSCQYNSCEFPECRGGEGFKPNASDMLSAASNTCINEVSVKGQLVSKAQFGVLSLQPELLMLLMLEPAQKPFLS